MPEGSPLFRIYRPLVRERLRLWAGLILPLLLLPGCRRSAHERPPAPSRAELKATAESALARAATLKRDFLKASDQRALEELAAARSASRAAGEARLEARALNETGALELRQNRFAGATSAFAQALDLARRSGDVQGQATALNGQGDLLLERFTLTSGPESAGAIAKYEEALRLSRRVGDRSLEGKTRLGLGNAYQKEGQLEKSLEQYRQALKLQTIAREAEGALAILSDLGGVYLKLGETELAFATLSRGLEQSRRLGDPAAEASLLTNFAAVQLRQGRLEESVLSNRQALNLYQRAGTPLPEAYASFQLATACLYLGQRDPVPALYQRGIDLCRQAAGALGVGLPKVLAGPLVFLGSYRQPEIGFEEAQRLYFKPALELVESGARDGEISDSRAAAYHFYGRSLNEAGKPRQALEYLAKAIPALEKNGPESYLARTRMEIGKAWRALGSFAAAQEALAAALRASRRLHDFLLEAVTCHELARLELGRGHLRQALGYSRKTLAIVDAIRSKVASQQLRMSFFASRQVYYKFHLSLLMELHRREPRHGYDRDAFEVSERARTRALLDLLAEGRIDITQDVPGPLKRREQALEQRVSRLQSSLFSGRSTREVGAQLRAAELDRRQLEADIRRQSPRYAGIRNPVIRGAPAVQALLDDRTAFLEYALTEEQPILFVVTRERFQSFLLPTTTARLEARVADLRRALADPRSLFAFPRTAESNYTLFQDLLREALPLLDGKPRWLIAADGPLLLLNFEILPTRPPSPQPGFDQPYLIEERTLHYVPSASVMAELLDKPSTAESRTARLELFALADPTLAASPAPEGPFRRRGLAPVLPPLLEARREAAGIARLYPESSAVFVGPAATEGVVWTDERFRHSRRLHFATHGVFDEGKPENSALLLTPDLQHDGRLTVAKIFNLKLSADLVVLSACNTGEGRHLEGEGLIGMTRAFFYAGAPAMVVSLWPADDAATADLMISFYRYLRDRSPAEALRAAKLDLLHRETGLKKSPHYWAPFILLGRSAPATP